MQCRQFFNRDDESFSSNRWRGVLSFLAVVFVLGIASPAFAAVESYTIGVDGMACPFCAYGIEKKLKGVDGVESLNIRIKDGEVDVTVAEDGTVTPKELNKAIKEAGFAIRKLTVTGTAAVEKTNGTFRVKLSEDFALPLQDYDGESGEFEIRAEVLKPAKDGKRRLRIIERKE